MRKIPIIIYHTAGRPDDGDISSAADTSQDEEHDGGRGKKINIPVCFVFSVYGAIAGSTRACFITVA